MIIQTSIRAAMPCFPSLRSCWVSILPKRSYSGLPYTCTLSNDRSINYHTKAPAARPLVKPRRSYPDVIDPPFLPTAAIRSVTNQKKVS